MAGPAISLGLLILILVSGAVSLAADTVSPLTRLCHSTAYSPGAGAIAKYRGFVPATTSGPSGCVNVRSFLGRWLCIRVSPTASGRTARARWMTIACRLLTDCTPERGNMQSASSLANLSFPEPRRSSPRASATAIQDRCHDCSNQRAEARQ